LPDGKSAVAACAGFGGKLARAGARIVPAVRAWTEERGVDVWFREGGLLKVSAAPAQDASLSAPVEAARSLGVPDEAVALSRQQLEGHICSPRFREGVFFRDCAKVQPARLARALRTAILDAGIELHERSPVLRIRDRELTLARGRVRAREVVLAVNAAATGWRPLAGALTNFGSYVVLTEPVPELLEQIGGDIRFGGGPAKDVGEDDVIGFRVVGCRCSR